jgi:menaquinone-dependent protoporphyrinogen oxidase
MFQVSMTSAGTDPARVAKAQELMQKLVDGGGVQPDLLAMFAGAIKYSQYGWVMKRVMRSIARREGNDTDMTRDHEYTDWDAVDRFARDVAALVQTRRPVGSPPVGAT